MGYTKGGDKKMKKRKVPDLEYCQCNICEKPILIGEEAIIIQTSLEVWDGYAVHVKHAEALAQYHKRCSPISIKKVIK